MNEVALRQENSDVITMGFGTKSGFELMQRAANLLASSQLVPKEYQGSIPNCTIALEMSARIGCSPLMCMQNLYIVHGKPSWSSQFIIAAVNNTQKFSPLRFNIADAGEKTVTATIVSYEWTGGSKKKISTSVSEKIRDRVCVAWATELSTGERLESPPISIEMAVQEGWYSKDGSKWKTMPELMLRYRSATLFGRLYAPEVLMGMRAYEEIIDIEGGEVINIPKAEKAPATPTPTPAEEVPPKAESVKGFDKKIPKSVDREQFDKFLAVTAEMNGITVDKLKADAHENKQMPQVLEWFMAWQKENAPEPPKGEDIPEVAQEMAPKECPNSPDNVYTRKHCDACKNRTGCPVWFKVDTMENEGRVPSQEEIDAQNTAEKK